MTLWMGIYIVAYVVFFAATEIIKRWKDLRPESTRKVVHVGTSAIACSMPFFISRNEVMILAGMFMLLLMATKQFGLFTSVQGVQRKTIGEFTFPLSAAISAWLFLPSSPYAFVLGFAILGLADTAAQVVGTRWSFLKLKIMGQMKSVGGGIAFAIVTSALYWIAGILLHQDIKVAKLLIAALALSLVELSQVFGLDNLFIPPLAAWLWLWISA